MYKSSAPKRTGIYRIKGNIADLRLELKLRHVSEWLPVPKFEYTGAKLNYGDHYPESPRNGGWSDCFIYVPYEDQYGNNYYTYYNYYNPGSDYPGSSRTSRTSRSSSSGIVAAASRTYPSSSHSQLGEQPVDAAFSALNPELSNGSTASLYIGWQQKHFSRTELERYGDASQCKTTLQRRYHRWTRHIVELQRRHRLRVQREQAEQQIRVRRRRKSKRKSTHSKTPPLSSLAISECSVETQPLPPPDDPNFAARTCLVHTLIDADLRELPQADWPPEAQQLHDQGYQLMFVYAQLQQDTLLLSLRYQPAEGLLYVYPDFSTTADDMDYVLQIDNDCRQLYAYGFHLAAIDAGAANAAQPADQLLEQLPTPADSLPGSEASAEQLVSYYQAKRSGASALRRLLQFQLPPKRMRRVTLLLQLHEAQHFEYPNIHVRYYVNPPSHTLLEPANPNDPFPLRGATATSVAGGAARLAHFSHCWQLTLLCEESHEPHQLLHIYFEVISVDGWQRERCEGYAHFACSLLSPLPAAASAGLRLQCIRPMGSWLDALNRYFIGGRSLFDFVGYFKSRSRDNLIHNRLEAGSRHIMRSTGTLLFSLQKLQQRHQPLGHLLAPEDSDDDDSPAPGHSDKPAVSATLQEVLVAYVEARERIEALLGQSALV